MTRTAKSRFDYVGYQVSQVKDQIGQGQGQELDNIFISQSWESLLLWLTFVKTSFFKPEYVSQWTVISIDIKRSWDTIYQRYYEFRDITISLAKISYSEIWLSDGLTDIDDSRVVFATDIRKGKLYIDWIFSSKLKIKCQKAELLGNWMLAVIFVFHFPLLFLWFQLIICDTRVKYYRKNYNLLKGIK